MVFVPALRENLDRRLYLIEGKYKVKILTDYSACCPRRTVISDEGLRLGE